MQPEVMFYNKETGEVIATLNTVKSSSVYVGGKGIPRIPRAYTIKNIEGNEELYNQLLKHIGKTFRIESDQVNGLFNITLDGEEIILNEVIN